MQTGGAQSRIAAGAMQRRTPIFFVVSARPRVGKTTLARVLADYFRSDGRLFAAFDVNPTEFSLAEHMPAFTAVSSIDDTKGQMALFDQLVADDGVPKIVDVGHGLLERFFSLIQDIDFLGEARRRGLAPVALFLADPDRRSEVAYVMLQHRFADMTLVPVINEAVPHVVRFSDRFTPARGGRALSVPALAPVIKSVIERPGFSFIGYSAKAPDQTSELYGWIRHLFLEFRDLELRMLLEELKPDIKFTA